MRKEMNKSSIGLHRNFGSSVVVSRKALIMSAITAAGCIAFPETSSAATAVYYDQPDVVHPLYMSDYLDYKADQLISMLCPLYSSFEISDEDKLVLLASESSLVDNFGCSNEDLVSLYAIQSYYNDSVQRSSKGNALGNTRRRLHVSNWKVYFTYAETVNLLWQAALAGPPAIAAALSGLGSIYPGVGTVIGAAIGLIGGGTIAYQVTQAVSLKKGFYIGVTWNGPFPNPDVGTW